MDRRLCVPPPPLRPPSGHTVKAVCESFELSKDAGYKVVAHMMPDLPNVGLERDLEQFIVRRGPLVCWVGCSRRGRAPGASRLESVNIP